MLRLARPDKSVRTFWRGRPDEVALKEAGLEAVLPESATLAELTPALLAPGVLPGLWQGTEFAVGDLYAYFAGGHVVKVPREGYEEPVTIPQAEQPVVDAAIQTAVKNGKLWLTSGPASIWAEEIPAGLLAADAHLQAPPAPVSAVDVLRERLPEAWSGEITTALTIAAVLSKRAGKTLPWAVIQTRAERRLPCPSPGAHAGFRPLAVRLRRRGQRPATRAPRGAATPTSTAPAAQARRVRGRSRTDAGPDAGPGRGPARSDDRCGRLRAEVPRADRGRQRQDAGWGDGGEDESGVE